MLIFVELIKIILSILIGFSTSAISFMIYIRQFRDEDYEEARVRAKYQTPPVIADLMTDLWYLGSGTKSLAVNSVIFSVTSLVFVLIFNSSLNLYVSGVAYLVSGMTFAILNLHARKYQTIICFIKRAVELTREDAKGSTRIARKIYKIFWQSMAPIKFEDFYVKMIRIFAQFNDEATKTLENSPETGHTQAQEAQNSV